jgi:hypothetical protein
MCNVVRWTWLIVAMAIASCGSDMTEDRSGLGGHHPGQQGRKYAVHGGVSTRGMQPESGPSRVDGSVNIETSDMVGRKFEVRGGTFHGAQ